MGGNPFVPVSKEQATAEFGEILSYTPTGGIQSGATASSNISPGSSASPRKQRSGWAEFFYGDERTTRGLRNKMLCSTAASNLFFIMIVAGIIIANFDNAQQGVKYEPSGMVLFMTMAFFVWKIVNLYYLFVLAYAEYGYYNVIRVLNPILCFLMLLSAGNAPNPYYNSKKRGKSHKKSTPFSFKRVLTTVLVICVGFITLIVVVVAAFVPPKKEKRVPEEQSELRELKTSLHDKLNLPDMNFGYQQNESQTENNRKQREQDTKDRQNQEDEMFVMTFLSPNYLLSNYVNINHELPYQEIQNKALRDFFEPFDTDHQGIIDVKELAVMIKKINPDKLNEKIKELSQEPGENKSETAQTGQMGFPFQTSGDMNPGAPQHGNMPPQNILPQNMPPQNMPPQNMPPRNTPPRNMPPHNMPPREMQERFPGAPPMPAHGGGGSFTLSTTVNGKNYSISSSDPDGISFEEMKKKGFPQSFIDNYIKYDSDKNGKISSEENRVMAEERMNRMRERM